ncbi:VOC family protein [Pseudaestuariivita atlantica]|uniref:Glyoxalase n=1 Tax=Pseudaestuariivita atlantica TaxID=1317121 RepID=A0A0L1JQ44_9RHOB|nr:VOC family protein [Pseudaestuariivita atlantica]KNG93889.1 glyoxalase [Pseudaestuariivita atlantica]
MDYETISAEAFGAGLTGFGVNLLVRDVVAEVAFLRDVFGIVAHRVSADFAILAYHGHVLQLHSDGTYHSNPLPSLLPEAGARGGGIELRLFHTDPDEAVKKARAAGAMILAEAENKPHGLREAYILDDNGYAWVPSRPTDDE